MPKETTKKTQDDGISVFDYVAAIYQHKNPLEEHAKPRRLWQRMMANFILYFLYSVPVLVLILPFVLFQNYWMSVLVGVGGFFLVVMSVNFAINLDKKRNESNEQG